MFITIWIISKSTWKAGAVTTLVSILFFSYGHAYELLAVERNPVYWLTTIWLIILIVSIWWVGKRTSGLLPINHVLNWFSIILVILSFVPNVVDLLQQSPETESNHSVQLQQQVDFVLPAKLPEPLPDIYYIVLDGYGRADILADIYDFDNSPLLEFFNNHDFYIAEGAFSNYNQTILSFPSALNLTYIQDILDTSSSESFDYWTHVELVRENAVINIAQEAGYSVVVFQSGHSATEVRHADHFMRIENAETDYNGMLIPILDWQIHLDSYEIRFLETTAFRFALTYLYAKLPEHPKYEIHRRQIEYTFANLDAFTQEQGPYFVFAHIVAPHPPFVFQADGESNRNWRPYTIFDGSHWIGAVGTRNDYIVGYREQITYINSLLMSAIERILANSENPPVIIVQSDHGPGAYFDWNSVNRTDVRERMGILNAYYFPGGDEGVLYPTVSPVNSFRLVFNRYLGTNFEHIDDRAYYSEWREPYHFTDVTHELLKLPEALDG